MCIAYCRVPAGRGLQRTARAATRHGTRERIAHVIRLARHNIYEHAAHYTLWIVHTARYLTLSCLIPFWKQLPHCGLQTLILVGQKYLSHNVFLNTGLPRSKPNADQCRSKSLHWSKLLLNTDLKKRGVLLETLRYSSQYLSTPINAGRLDWHWEALRSIEKNWSASGLIMQYLSALGIYWGSAVNSNLTVAPSWSCG